jgi:hypothetical protein
MFVGIIDASFFESELLFLQKSFKYCGAEVLLD